MGPIQEGNCKQGFRCFWNHSLNNSRCCQTQSSAHGRYEVSVEGRDIFLPCLPGWPFVRPLCVLRHRTRAGKKEKRCSGWGRACFVCTWSSRQPRAAHTHTATRSPVLGAGQTAELRRIIPIVVPRGEQNKTSQRQSDPEGGLESNPALLYTNRPTFPQAGRRCSPFTLLLCRKSHLLPPNSAEPGSSQVQNRSMSGRKGESSKGLVPNKAMEKDSTSVKR